MSKEVFKQFRNTDFYISNLGNLKNMKTGNFIKGTKVGNGYLRTNIPIGESRKSFFIHRIVGEVWLEDFSHDLTINHKDGVTDNNEVSNLEMLSRSDNAKYSYEVLGRDTVIDKRAVLQCDLEGNFIEEFESVCEAARVVDRTPSAIHKALNGETNTSAGYVWKYSDSFNRKIEKIIVPSNVKYLSDFIPQLPSNVIVNKGICGVGATTCEIRSNRNSIILCPTKNLVESKAISENIFGVTGDVKDKEILLYCALNETKKIIATYDALPRLINLVPDVFNYFLLIDEYHVLFTSYHYRRKAVRYVLNNYKLFNEYCFMTATPLDNFQVLEEIKDLPIIEYKWTNASKVKITIENGNALQKNLHSYIATSYNYNYNLHIFVNSIEFIRSIVKNYKLKDYRTVCSESSKEKAEKYNLNFARAYDPIAKINFYTAASFEGVDLYDENGFTIIVADAKKENTLMDISTLMFQICGRIRNSKYNNQVLLLLDTRKYRYTKWSSFEEFKEDADHNELIGLEKERVFDEESPLYQKGEIESYNEEKDLKYYLIVEDDKLLLDKNLKNVDLENFNLIEQVYESNISVLTEVQGTELFEVQGMTENKLDSVTMKIYDAIGLKDYDADEMKNIVFPIFKKYGINCNNVTLGKYLKPITTKSRKMIKGTRKTIYLKKMI